MWENNDTSNGKRITVNESPMNASSLQIGEEVSVCWKLEKAEVLMG
jgi:hypothetical protein